MSDNTKVVWTTEDGRYLYVGHTKDYRIYIDHYHDGEYWWRIVRCDLTGIDHGCHWSPLFVRSQATRVLRKYLREKELR